MKFMNAYLLTAITAIALAGCSKSGSTDTGLPDNPGITTTDPNDSDFDFAPELADPATRYVSEELTLRYDSGGIMVTRTASSIRFVDLGGGGDVLISSGTPFQTGFMTNVTIVENGKPLPIKSFKTERLSTTQIYLNILTADNRRIIAAVTDL